MPTAAQLDRFYAGEYTYDAHLLIAAEKRWRSSQLLEAALPSNARRVLDVGCMYGYLLDEVAARGLEGVGVELSAAPARAAIEKGLRVHTGTIESFAADDSSKFELVTAQHVLEHIPDPAAFLRQARSFLQPNGKLCISVPNYDARTRRVFHEAWGWYQVPVHLFHFGERGLETLLHDAGYRVEQRLSRGGDSLFLMMTLLQSVAKTASASSRTRAPSALSRTLIRAVSRAARPYYFLGDDELIYVASPR